MKENLKIKPAVITTAAVVALAVTLFWEWIAAAHFFIWVAGSKHPLESLGDYVFAGLIGNCMFLLGGMIATFASIGVGRAWFAIYNYLTRDKDV